MWHLNIQNRITGLDYHPIPPRCNHFHLYWSEWQQEVIVPPFKCCPLCSILLSSMTLVPLLKPPTLHQAAPLLMTTAPMGSRTLPVDWGGTVTAHSGAPTAACVNQDLQDLSAIEVFITNSLYLSLHWFLTSHRCVISHSKMSLRATFSAVHTKPPLAQRARLKRPRCQILVRFQHDSLINWTPVPCLWLTSGPRVLLWWPQSHPVPALMVAACTTDEGAGGSADTCPRWSDPQPPLSGAKRISAFGGESRLLVTSLHPW